MIIIKSKPTNSEQERILMETFETQLRKQQAIGMSYGSKMFAATVEDIIKNLYINDIEKDAPKGENGEVLISYIQSYKNSNIDFFKLSKKQLIDIVKGVFEFANNTVDIHIDELVDTVTKIQSTSKDLQDCAESPLL